MTRFAAPIAEQIWDMKYRLKEADGTAVDALHRMNGGDWLFAVEAPARLGGTDFEPRLTFFLEDEVMEADFSDFTFHHARDVDDFYDYIEELIRRTELRLGGRHIWEAPDLVPERLHGVGQFGQAARCAGRNTRDFIVHRTQVHGQR